MSGWKGKIGPHSVSERTQMPSRRPPSMLAQCTLAQSSVGLLASVADE